MSIPFKKNHLNYRYQPCCIVHTNAGKKKKEDIIKRGACVCVGDVRSNLTHGQ